MKYRFLLAFCFAGVCAQAWAQVTTAAADRELYLDYLDRNARASVCAERLPDFGARLAPLLRKWKVRHESQLRVGDSFLHAEALRDQISVEERMEQATREALTKVRALPDGEVGAACAKVADWFEGKTEADGAGDKAKGAGNANNAANAAPPG